MKKYGIKLDDSQVLPVNQALQGDKESPHLWEGEINGNLHKEGLTYTTHERNLYRGKVNGKDIILRVS